MGAHSLSSRDERVNGRMGGVGRHRKQHRRIEPYSWLGAGAITLGIGAAMFGGSAVANAETDGNTGSITSTAQQSTAGEQGSDSSESKSGGVADAKPVSNVGTGQEDDVSQDDEIDKSPSTTSSAGASGSSGPLTSVSASGGNVKTQISGGGVKTTSLVREKDRKGTEKPEEPQDDLGVSSNLAVKEENAEEIIDTPSAPVEIEEIAVDNQSLVIASPQSTVSSRSSLSAPDHDLKPLEKAVINSSQTFSVEADATIQTLAVTTTAAVDPAREAYLQQFRDADPNDLYWTPASPDYNFTPRTYTEEEYREFIASQVARTGTQGFSQTFSGALQYTNPYDQNVAVLYGRRAGGIEEPAGIMIVRPGQTVVLPYPDGAVAAAQLPKGDRRLNEVAGAAVGYPPFTRTPATGPVQIISNLVSNFVRSIQAQIADLQAQIAWNSRPSAPSNAGALFSRLVDRTANDADKDADKIAIEKVQAQRGGDVRLIVYLGGTTVGNPHQGVWTNIPAYTGATKQHQIDAINRALNGNPNAEIMLVGYSQGGLDAQNLAEIRVQYNWNVTTVVTYGSPITKRPSTGYRIIHIADTFDPVPDMGPIKETRENAFAGNIFERRASTTTAWNLFWDPFGYNVHTNRATYESIGRQFENDTSSRLRGIKDNMNRFEGKVIQVS